MSTPVATGNGDVGFATGTAFATDVIAGVVYPISKIDWGALGASQPLSAANPLPVSVITGFALEAGHIATIDAKLPGLGQALAAASMPVVLTAAQITTLTPPAAITGFALEAGHLATIDTKTPALGQALAAGSSPVVLTAIQQTALTPPAAITGFALEAGHLATIDTSTAKIPAQGQALAAASMPVVLPAAQVTTLTPPAAITGFALEAGHLSTIDTSTAKIPANVAKGTQGATATPTQDLKDSGRSTIMITAEFAPTAVAEALLTLSKSVDGAAVSTGTSLVITNGKRFRITSWQVTSENTLGVNPKRNKLRLRFAATGGALVGSPLQANLVSSVSGTVNTVGTPAWQDFPDGIEFLGDGTKAFGITNESPDWVTAAQTSKIYLTLTGFEY